MRFEKDGIAVDFEDIGEGKNGDYDPEWDPTDYPHLRFYVSKLEDDEWVDVGNASYCTTLHAEETPKEDLLRHAESIWNVMAPSIKKGVSVKKLGEICSWVGTENFERLLKNRQEEHERLLDKVLGPGA